MNGTVAGGEIIAGKYRVERLLARGGSGIVFEAKHLQLLEQCAIKFMAPATLDVPMAHERFVREARAVARLKNDHVVKVFDVGEHDGAPYIVMEYLEGSDLQQVVEHRGPLPVEEAVLYVLQICTALAEAHALGIIHRDLKPANAFLTRTAGGEPRVKLLDFGISRTAHDPEGLNPVETGDGVLTGTPLFMAPEQICRDEVDARTDVWAVGVILFNLLTERLPFQGGDVLAILGKIMSSPAPAPSSYNPAIPTALEQVILRCLQKDPAHRPASVIEVARDLTPFAGVEGPTLSRHVRRVFDSAAELHAGGPTLPALRVDPVMAPRVDGSVPAVLSGETPRPSAVPSQATVPMGHATIVPSDERSRSSWNSGEGITADEHPPPPRARRHVGSAAAALGTVVLVATAILFLRPSSAPTDALPRRASASLPAPPGGAAAAVGATWSPPAGNASAPETAASTTSSTAPIASASVRASPAPSTSSASSAPRAPRSPSAGFDLGTRR